MGMSFEAALQPGAPLPPSPHPPSHRKAHPLTTPSTMVRILLSPQSSSPCYHIYSASIFRPVRDEEYGFCIVVFQKASPVLFKHKPLCSLRHCHRHRHSSHRARTYDHTYIYAIETTPHSTDTYISLVQREKDMCVIRFHPKSNSHHFAFHVRYIPPVKCGSRIVFGLTYYTTTHAMGIGGLALNPYPACPVVPHTHTPSPASLCVPEYFF